MGALQFKGFVSGFGKGIQRGAENMQMIMGQQMLQEERQKAELERLRLTFGQESGILGKRFAHEDTMQTRQIASTEGEGAKGRQNQRYLQGNQIEATETNLKTQLTHDTERQDKDISTRKEMQGTEITARKDMQEDEISSREREGKATRKNARDLEDKREKFAASEGDKDRTLKQGMHREQIGADIVAAQSRLQALRERGMGGRAGAKEYIDPETDRMIDVYMEELKGLNHVIQNSMKKEQIAAAQRRVAEIREETRHLLGFQAEKGPAAPSSIEGIGQFDKFKK